MLVLPATYALWNQMANCTARMEFRTDPAGPAVSEWDYRYDDDGDLRWAQMQDPSGHVNMRLAFEYRSPGELSQVLTNPGKDGRGGAETDYIWQDGDPVLAWSESAERAGALSVTRTWWAEGARVESATDSNCDGRADSFETFWTDASPFGLERELDGLDADSAYQERFSYDELGRLVRSELSRDGTGSVDRTVWRGYDDAGRILLKSADNDGDGVADTEASWAWWCPGDQRLARASRTAPGPVALTQAATP